MPLPGGRVLDPLLDEPLAAGTARRRRGRRRRCGSARRGRRELEAPALEIEDPLRIQTAAGPRPRRRRGARPAPDRAGGRGSAGGRRGRARAGGLGAGSGGAGLEAAAVDLELDGLRPYRQGAPATRIHWPTVARRGEMVELRLVAGADRLPLIALDSCRPPRRGGARLRGPRRGLAVRPPGAARRAAARSCSRERSARSRSSAGWRAGRAPTPGWRSSSPRESTPSLRRAARASTVHLGVRETPGAAPARPRGLRSSCVLVDAGRAGGAPAASSPSPAARASPLGSAAERARERRHEAARVRRAGGDLRAAAGAS